MSKAPSPLIPIYIIESPPPLQRLVSVLLAALILAASFGSSYAQAPTAGIVNATANVRSGPGINNGVVGSLPEGAAVEISGCNAPCDWYQIGPDRWIAAFLVDATTTPPTAPATSSEPVDAPQAIDLMEVHFLDVDQGDSILLEGPDFTILIDAGRHDRNDVVAQLQQYGVQSIDLFVGTHPHADHIGQVKRVFDAYPVTDVWMSGELATTATFERALDAIDAEGAGYSEPRAGEVYEIGSARLEILNPSHLGHDDVNDGSIVIRLVFGDVAFLFTGDAEAVAEAEMLAAGRNLQAQILKVGHHGSSSSSTLAFLEAVDPEIAIWSAGEGNDYGHPHQSTIDRLAQLGIETHGTATEGAITICTDGHAYNIGTCETRISAIDQTGLLPTPTTVASVVPTTTSAPTCPTANTFANLRAGPGTNFDVVGRATQGACLTITGRNEASDWFLLDGGTWIAVSLVDSAPAFDEIPVVAVVAPPTATEILPTPIQPTATPVPPTATPTQQPEANCDPSYPDFCLEPGIADLDCGEISWRRFRVLQPDPHGFDGNDNDGLGCESN